jgi:G:T-mismatch repair DNA endonuclease (very short patch repair protein)
VTPLRCGYPRCRRTTVRPRRGQKFCSVACNRAFYNAYVEVKCCGKGCGTRFWRRKRDMVRNNFCGERCSQRWFKGMTRKFGGPAPKAYQGPNGLEKQLAAVLVDVGIPVRFVGDDPTVLVVGVSVDFMNETLGIVVECFGGNWHTHHDAASRLRLLRAGGWRAVVVWEREIRGPNWFRPRVASVEELRRRLRRWWRGVKRSPARDFAPPTRQPTYAEEAVPF